MWYLVQNGLVIVLVFQNFSIQNVFSSTLYGVGVAACSVSVGIFFDQVLNEGAVGTLLSNAIFLVNYFTLHIFFLFVSL